MSDASEQYTNSQISYAYVASIANGQSLSSEFIDLKGLSLVGLLMPAAWTAATMTLVMSHDAATSYNVFDGDGTEVELTVSAGQYIKLSPSDFAGIHFLKLRSGTASAPVNQGAARSIILAARPV
jgi:hypothetical protein